MCGLRFLYEVTLAKPWAVRHIPFGKRPKKLPTVLSDQEASRLLQCVQHPQHRAVLLTCYAAGLRLAEATHLRLAEVDGQRAQRANRACEALRYRRKRVDGLRRTEFKIGGRTFSSDGKRLATNFEFCTSEPYPRVCHPAALMALHR